MTATAAKGCRRPQVLPQPWKTRSWPWFTPSQGTLVFVLAPCYALQCLLPFFFLFLFILRPRLIRVDPWRPPGWLFEHHNCGCIFLFGVTSLLQSCSCGCSYSRRCLIRAGFRGASQQNAVRATALLRFNPFKRVPHPACLKEWLAPQPS